MAKSTETEKDTTSIVPASPNALAVQSAALVRRGLRDLARDSNWLIKKIFTRRIPEVAVSPAGQVCANSHDSRAGRPRISIFDVDLASAPFNLVVPWPEARSGPKDGGGSGCIAWSPCGRYIAVTSPEWPLHIHIFDGQTRSYLFELDRFNSAPASLAWSSRGNFLAASWRVGGDSSIRIWRAESGEPPAAGSSAKEAAAAADWITDQSAEEEFGDGGRFQGYGKTVFSPNEQLYASVVEFEGDWADDSVMVSQTEPQRRIEVFQAQGHVTDVSWTADNEQIVFCSGGQAYIQRPRRDRTTLPFAAEICRCHPTLRLAGCYSSWLKNSAKGRLFVADLSDGNVIDECPAEGVVDIRWNQDGTKLYAVTQNGLAYLYENTIAF